MKGFFVFWISLCVAPEPKPLPGLFLRAFMQNTILMVLPAPCISPTFAPLIFNNDETIYCNNFFGTKHANEHVYVSV